eukprot:749123_1
MATRMSSLYCIYCEQSFEASNFSSHLVERHQPLTQDNGKASQHPQTDQDLKVAKYGTVPPNHMRSLLHNLDIVYHEFVTKFPFDSFVPNDKYTPDTIIDRVNDKMIEVLNAISYDGVGLDVAFVQITALIFYAASIQPYQQDTHMDYYPFCQYFIIYGCCLGTKYSKSMVLPDKCFTNNDVFRYFIFAYKNQWPSRINYTYCGSQRESIIGNISRCLSSQFDHYGNYLPVLIADYATFEFEEFFHVMNNWISRTYNTDRCGKNFHICINLEDGTYATVIPLVLLRSPLFKTKV